jgi:hypothetical protein
MEQYKKYAIPAVIAVIVLGGLIWAFKAKNSNDDGAQEVAKQVEISFEDNKDEKSDVVFLDHNICGKTVSAPEIKVNGVDIVARVFSLETAGTSTAFCEKMTLVPNKAVLSAYLKNTSRDGVTWQLLINNMEYSVNVVTEDIGKVMGETETLLGKIK